MIIMIIKITVYLLLKTYTYTERAQGDNCPPLALQGPGADVVCGAYKNRNKSKAN